MADKTLRQWSDDNNINYYSAWRDFQSNKIQGAYKTPSGRIYVKESTENVASQALALTSSKSMYNIPDLKYENISMSAIDTRKNRSAESPIISRFANIDEGLVPYTSNYSGADNRSGLVTRDAIILTQKAYFNIAIFRQIIDLIVDLSIGNIFLRGGNKKSRNFFTAYFKHIGLNSFQEQWFLELWKSSNVLTFAYEKALRSDDVKKITSTYGLSEAGAKVTVPVRFTILNPADIQVGAHCMFLYPQYTKVLNGYELARLRNKDLNDSDRQVLDSFPPDIKAAIKDRKTQTVSIKLPAENLFPAFYKKMDYEGLAIPVFFPVLDDINWKLQLKKMDMATTRMMNQAILLVTTGTDPDKGGINQNNISLLTTIFQNESVGRVLVADYTTTAQFIIPEIATILDPKKYEVVNNDIYIGLNYILLQGEKFANKQTALQLFIEKINYGRRLFINEFLSKVIEKVSKELGFKNYPEAYFEEVAIRDVTERNRIIARLAELGQLTPKETFEALDDGRLPLPDESLNNQEEFKSYRDKGYYQPLVGGPKAQMDLLKEKNKSAIQLQDSRHVHEDKQKSKDRKFNADNPKSPAPQIILKSPTQLAKPEGRPKGATRQQSTKKIKPLGASLISGAKVIQNTILFDKLQHQIINQVLEKYKIKSLKSEQMQLVEELANVIARNENPNNWEQSIASYIENPKDKNIERIEEIEELAAYHQIDPNLAAILYASIQKEDEGNNSLDINGNNDNILR